MPQVALGTDDANAMESVLHVEAHHVLFVVALDGVLRELDVRMKFELRHLLAGLHVQLDQLVRVAADQQVPVRGD